MKKQLSVFSLVAVLLFNVSNAQAAVVGDFGIDAGASWGLGAAHSDSVTSRTINTISINAFPNYQLGDWRFGINGNLGFVGQNTDPVNVANTNVKGTTLLFGVAAEYNLMSAWVFGAGFNFLGKYSLSENNTAGQSVSYKKPIGFFLKAGYYVCPMVSVDASFSYVTYGTSSTNSVDSDLTSKLKETNYAIGGTYHW